MTAVFIRRETPADVDAIRTVTQAAFGPQYAPEPAPEPGLVDQLRADSAWLPALSLVAEVDGEIVGHVVCTRGRVGDTPALGLGPLSVHPGHQRAGVGSALMHAVLGGADALGEPLVALLGDPGYYRRFGFRPAPELGVLAPDAEWGIHFQARPLAGYDPAVRGLFTYAEPFLRL
ncbi:GNAT family N-acetyltransferase [Catellatospora citrea]|uniref:GNAT family N-acetyltransferase n=1 Tax=Catellatospora citrea TaxID=53366 RepID=UPI000FEE717D|nr:N-acetyltransferase [Catellatospora citrea]RKE06852.1 putative acetyltransferase [Catellatospora citrea]